MFAAAADDLNNGWMDGWDGWIGCMHGHIHEEFIRTLIKRCTVIASFELSIESTIEQENVQSTSATTDLVQRTPRS
jgi:hypothetical protein